ncbi:hypothetical protein [Duganella phyllosphaerae]|uniref:Uncharacterized protein n=1 Tax=Duganella phyllosphaerae TaxID=762836 RepID=A0A1E7X5W8_9BURK|nr:hypothetical protein [Duganella phyllosphaerae]OFA08440.1 hypothetical protein DUPY_06960 [Duganella phyllosphaerae]
MTPHDAFKEIKRQIPSGTSLTDALSEFVKFYASTSIEGCPKDAEQDMLLFEWGGPYSWDPCVSLSLTRQFSLNDEDGDYDRMQQLHMHCRYDANHVALVAGNHWLYGESTDAFLQYVLDAPSTRTVIHLNMLSLDFEIHGV